MGDAILSIRTSLENKESVNLKDYPSIITFVGPATDLYEPKTDINRELWRLAREENVLLIHPVSGKVGPRKKFVTNFQNRFHLIEAIDDEDFYRYAKLIDQTTLAKLIPTAFTVLGELFGTSKILNWLTQDKIKDKRSDKPNVIQTQSKLLNIFAEYRESKRGHFFKNLIELFDVDLKLHCYRREILWSLKDAIDICLEKEISVFEAMKLNRNRIRRTGRKVGRRCIGTTLLTKGLEFDTVAVLNCHLIKCPKNLYVAISRARKNLIIITDTSTLFPYKA